jgi:4-carboxymuconolactone decarboxylase
VKGLSVSTDKERADAGLAIRKRVLGAETVERTLAGADEYTQEWQDYVNRACWGEVWSRTDIEPRIRSLLTLAILATLGKSTELQSHTRGAFANGCTVDEIKGVFFHVAVYAGVPAAFDAFRSTQPVVKELTSGS